MATRIGKYGATVRDARGQTGRVGGWVTWLDTSLTTRGDATLLAQSLAQQLVVMSNGQVIEYTGMAGEYFQPFQYGSAAQFQNAEDKARLIFVTATGVKVRFEVPAPKQSLFLADLETVDPANADLMTFISTATSVSANGNFASTRGGQAIVSFVAGQRIRRPFQRKTTIWTLTPDETGPEE